MNYNCDENMDPCDLECLRRGAFEPKVIHEYEGPVKITLVDLIDVGFWPRIIAAAFLAIANFFIAIVVATVTIFSLTFELPIEVNFHIAACMAGFQLLLPSGIMMLNSMFGPASQMVPKDRLEQHKFLQIAAFGFIFIGSFHVLTSVDSIPGNPHTFTGIMALLGAIAGVTLGILYHFFNFEKTRTPHTVVGIVTYIISSFCTCLAIMKPSFRLWCNKGFIPQVPFVLLILVTIYTSLVMMSVKCRIREVGNKYIVK